MMQTLHPIDPSDKDYWKHIVQMNNGFGIELFKQVAMAKPQDNIFMSPTSIFLVLCMLYNGAAGETFMQISQTLKLPNPSEINPWNRQLINHLTSQAFGHKLLIASALWFNKGIFCHDQFVNNCIESYSASLYGIDFASPEAPAQINYWAANATQDLIQNLVSDVRGQELLITNAVYFKGDWQNPFKSEKSAPEPFYPIGGQPYQVAMMHQTANFEYFESEAFQVIKLRYLNSPLFMQIVLPRPGFHFGHCLPALSNPTMPMIDCQINLSLPRFSMEFDFGLEQYFRNLGIINFSDFALICPGLKVSGITHTAKLKIDESGTEAAAATDLEFYEISSVRTPALQMKVDRPFLLNIVDGGSGQIIFSGAVVAPKEN